MSEKLSNPCDSHIWTCCFINWIIVNFKALFLTWCASNKNLSICCVFIKSIGGGFHWCCQSLKMIWVYTPQWIFGVAYQGKDIVFRFIIEYSTLRDFGPLSNNNRSIFLLYEDFWKMIFWLVSKPEISYRVIISLRILVSFRRFFEDLDFFTWRTIWVFRILLLPWDTL